MNEKKYELIALRLERNINNNAYSDKLPPVRLLSTEFGVSTRTMNKALKLLVEKGLVIPNGPRGNIINRRRVVRAKTNIVAVFSLSKDPSQKRGGLWMELDRLAKADGFDTLFMSASNSNIFNNENFWSSNWVDGYIFIYSGINKKFAYRLHKRGVPFVVANRLPSECGAHWVDFNLRMSLRTQLKYLIASGRKRVMLSYFKISLPSYIDYVEDVWTEILKEFESVSGVLEYFPEGSDRKIHSECAERFVKSEADALIILGLNPLLMEKELIARGRVLDADYSLIYRSYNLESYVDKFSCVLMPYKSLAAEAWNLFKRVVENPELQPQQILVDDEFSLKGN